MKGKIRSDPFSLKDILGIKDKKIGYNKINQIAFATNLQIDKNNQIINFDIPKPTKNKNQQYVFEGIIFIFQIFNHLAVLFVVIRKVRIFVILTQLDMYLFLKIKLISIIN